MAFRLTAKTKSILNQIEKNPSVVLDIEGIDLIISSSITFKNVYWDDDNITWDMDGITWDGAYQDPNTKNYLNLKESTNAITQQIYPDKEGSSSITSALFSIVDKNNEIAQTLSLNSIGEILGKQCDIYLGFVTAVYPDDFMPVMRGIITSYNPMPGRVMLEISHADSLRRQSILDAYSSNTTSSVSDVDTTIPVSSVSRFLPSQDALTSYIKIDDEIMEVTNINASSFDVIRSRLGTTAEAHDLDADVTSFYELTGEPLVLAQKLMLSDPDNEFFLSDITIKNFEYVSAVQSITNAIIFNHPDIEAITGLIQNDIISVENYSTYTVQSFGKLDSGDSYIIVNEDLDTVIDVGESWSLKSQYNVLNFGLSMLPSQVDVASFEYVKTNFSPNFTSMSFYFEDGIKDAREFINKELYFIAGCYGIPRNARSSVKFLSPPLSIEDLPTLNETNIINILDISPQRSINKFYYNNVLFKFNKSIQDGEFKTFSQFIDADSVNSFNVGNKQLKIESLGYRRNTQVDLIINRLSDRFLSRYKNAAIYIKDIKLPFKHGFNLQIGDVVLYGGDNTKQVDVYTGLRKLPIEKYEIINQKIDLKGEISIDILSTGFSVTGNFGVFSPSSLVSSGATTKKIPLKEINNLDEQIRERDKWNSLIGCKLNVRSEDYSYFETTTLLGLDIQDLNTITVDTLSVSAPIDAIVELADYDEQPLVTTDIGKYIRLKYTFTMFQDTIAAVAGDSVFEVADGGIYFNGMDIAVHSNDYTRDQPRATISTVVGNIITLTSDLDFTPQVGDKIEQLEFLDYDGYLFL